MLKREFLTADRARLLAVVADEPSLCECIVAIKTAANKGLLNVVVPQFRDCVYERLTKMGYLIQTSGPDYYNISWE